MPRMFWRVSFPIVLGHALLISILVSLGIAGWVSEFQSNLWQLTSTHDTGYRLMILVKLLATPLITISTLTAIIAFAMKRQGRSAHGLLVTYVSLQLGLGLLFVVPIVYQDWMGLQQGYTFGWYQFNQHFMVFAGYTIFSVPLLLLVGRGLWIWVIGKPPQVDEAGKYLRCVACNYNLRGTSGKTCPECGESVMADEANATTAAD